MIVNAYVLWCFKAKEELRCGEYFLIFYQSLLDFICVFASIVYTTMTAISFVFEYCDRKQYIMTVRKVLCFDFCNKSNGVFVLGVVFFSSDKFQLFN